MNLKNLRVLCVDDHETVRVLFLKCLTDIGVENIVEADNGKSALQKIQAAHQAQQPFDIMALRVVEGKKNSIFRTDFV